MEHFFLHLPPAEPHCNLSQAWHPAGEGRIGRKGVGRGHFLATLNNTQQRKRTAKVWEFGWPVVKNKHSFLLFSFLSGEESVFPAKKRSVTEKVSFGNQKISITCNFLKILTSHSSVSFLKVISSLLNWAKSLCYLESWEIGTSKHHDFLTHLNAWSNSESRDHSVIYPSVHPSFRLRGAS